MSGARVIGRMAWRHGWRRPLQSLFLIVGVAIGVAMIIAIDLANGSAQRAFELGTETVTGRATHQIVAGPTGMDEALYTRIRREIGYRQSAPVVEDYVVVPALDGQPMRLLGVDPFAESPFRSYLGANNAQDPTPAYLSSMMAEPNTVLLSRVTAARYGLQSGDLLEVRAGAKAAQLRIVGLLEPSDDLSRRALDSLLIADVGAAQEILGRVGRLDRIDLIVPENEAGAAALAQIEAILPPGARLEVSAARRGTVNEMTAAFSLNLTALSLLALVVGLFLIYNTVSFSVVQRRPVLGSLRALGMTRNEIFALILVEAVVLGIIGTALGLALGVVLGRGAVRLVTQTVNDLFFVASVREIVVPPVTLVKGALIGIAAAILGAVFPAWEATSVPPAGALRRSNVEERMKRALPWVTGLGVALLALGAALLVPDWNLILAFAGLFGVIFGTALLTPLLTLALMRLASGAALPWAGVIERMAPRTIVRALSRTSVAVAALMVSVSVIIGVGVMVGSFRETVVLWLQDVLQADIYVSPPSLTTTQVSATIDPAVVARLRGFPGIAQATTSRGVDVAAFLERTGNPDEATTVRLVAVTLDAAREQRRYRDAIGDWETTWAAVAAGGVVINEPMANRYDLGVGDTLDLQTDRGRQEFPIVGVSIDFDVNAVVVLHDDVYRRLWDDEAISAVALFVEPGVDPDAKVAELRAALAGGEFGAGELLVRSNRGTRDGALQVFDRTFSITVALQLLATIVAFIGILSTLMSLQLERAREIGVLRATGMTRGQLWRLSLLETGLMGVSAGLIALPAGYALAAILIYVINLRSFGWTLQMQLEAGEFVQAFAVAVGAALLAGIYPAWRMGAMEPIEALRSE